MRTWPAKSFRAPARLAVSDAPMIDFVGAVTTNGEVEEFRARKITSSSAGLRSAAMTLPQ